MKNLVFFGSNQVGDAVLACNVFNTICQHCPNVKIYVYNKNGNTVANILNNHPNVKMCETIATKPFSKAFYQNTYALYKQIKNLLQEGNVHLSSLIGTTTLAIALFPFLTWLKLTQKNKVIIMQLRPKWFKSGKHLVHFHAQLLSQTLGKVVEYQLSHSFLNNATQFKQANFSAANLQAANLQNKTFVIIPGASKMWKAFSAQQFTQVASHFASLGWKIVILGSSSSVDVFQASEITKLAKFPIENLTGKTTLNNYISAIASAGYVLANDSSAQHIANACNTPAAIIWGRQQHGQIARSYSWQTPLSLNIFPNAYRYCFKCNLLNKFKTKKQILQSHANCKQCITQNLQEITATQVINQIENHMKVLQI